jgi:tetratricopeptide (TPR) repeat protein
MIGTGGTARKSESIAFFVAEERPEGDITLRSLGPENVPFGKPKNITREELLERYLPEPQRSLEYVQAEGLRQQEVTRHVARGDKFYKRGENYSAEYEYDQALQIDEENVRANFGIGLCYIARKDLEKAREVFGRLVTLDAAFRDEHKHLFNEFGIRLRMAGLHPEALAYYSRAAELCEEDENLYYNMARAAFAMGEVSQASQHLCACLRLNCEHPEALQFSAYLRRIGAVAESCA